MSLSKVSSAWIQCLEEIINLSTELDRMCLEAELLARCCPLDNSQDHFHRTPISSSMLETLPLELRNAILVQLDIQSLTNLRRVSQSSRLAVEDIPQYRTLLAQAPELLRAVLSHGIARWTLIEDLFDALTSQTCALCGDFGPFVYLLSCSRACFACIAHNPNFCPQLASSAKERYLFDDRALADLPTLRSLPGSSDSILAHLHLVDRNAAKETAIALQNQFEETQKALGNWPMRRSFPLLRTAPSFLERSQWFFTSPWGRAILQEKNDKVDYQVDPRRRITLNSRIPRFVGVIRVPSLHRASGKVEWGFSCKGCKRGRRSYSPLLGPFWGLGRMYSQDGFLEHLECCTADLPNERWPESLASTMTGSESIETADQRKAYNDVRLVDPYFLNEAIAIVRKAYNKSLADIQDVANVDGTDDSDTASTNCRNLTERGVKCR